jgi:hypothetical protein
MHTNLFRRSLRWALATICLAAMTGSTSAGSFTRGCAARDIQILMLIEERENSNVVSPEKLSEHARMVCYEGHVMDALAIYDNIAQSLAPTKFGRR